MADVSVSFTVFTFLWFWAQSVSCIAVSFTARLGFPSFSQSAFFHGLGFWWVFVLCTCSLSQSTHFQSPVLGWGAVGWGVGWYILCNFSLSCTSSWPGLRVRASCVLVFHDVNVITVQAWDGGRGGCTSYIITLVFAACLHGLGLGYGRLVSQSFMM